MGESSSVGTLSLELDCNFLCEKVTILRYSTIHNSFPVVGGSCQNSTKIRLAYNQEEAVVVVAMAMAMALLLILPLTIHRMI